MRWTRIRLGHKTSTASQGRRAAQRACVPDSDRLAALQTCARHEQREREFIGLKHLVRRCTPPEPKRFRWSPIRTTRVSVFASEVPESLSQTSFFVNNTPVPCRRCIDYCGHRGEQPSPSDAFSVLVSSCPVDTGRVVQGLQSARDEKCARLCVRTLYTNSVPPTTHSS